MTIIAPVRVQKADGVVLVCMVAHGTDIQVRIVHQRHPTVPATNAGAGILCNPAGGNIPDLIFPLMRQIAPVQADGFLGQLGTAFREAPHDVPPELRCYPLRNKIFAQRLHMAEIQAALALLLGECLAAPLAQIERFVITDIEFAAAEKRAVFVNQPFYKPQRIGIGYVQGMVIPCIGITERNLFRVRQLAEVATGFCAENTVHMPEGRQGRNEFNVPGCAVIIQFHNLLRGQRRILTPCFAQVTEKIGVLNIKLPLVDLVAAENICHLFQVVQLRDTSAGAVLIIASVGKIGPVLNFQCGQYGSVLFNILAQCLHTVAECFIAAGFQRDAFRHNAQRVTVLRQGGIHRKYGVTCPGLTAGERHFQPGVLPQAALQHLCIKQRGGFGLPQGDSALIVQHMNSCRVFDLMWIRNKLHHHFLQKKARAAGALPTARAECSDFVI